MNSATVVLDSDLATLGDCATQEDLARFVHLVRDEVEAEFPDTNVTVRTGARTVPEECEGAVDRAWQRLLDPGFLGYRVQNGTRWPVRAVVEGATVRVLRNGICDGEYTLADPTDADDLIDALRRSFSGQVQITFAQEDGVILGWSEED